ncbi:MAG TPA: hypothetical protein VFV87_05625 [Pirellulaceae bacterium]|nr:hypothetical protein [Pirellulaceae bacterium]
MTEPRNRRSFAPWLGLLLALIAYPSLMLMVPDNSDDVALALRLLIAAIAIWLVVIGLRAAWICRKPPGDFK